MNKGGKVIKGVTKGLSGVAMDTIKQVAKEPVNIAQQAASQLGVGSGPQPAPSSDKNWERELAQAKAKDSQEIGQITQQLGQMNQEKDGSVQSQASDQAGLSGGQPIPPSQPERVVKLDQEIAQAREDKKEKYKKIEEDFLRRLEADRKEEEEAMEADAAAIMPQGRRKVGLPTNAQGKQGTKETKVK